MSKQLLSWHTERRKVSSLINCPINPRQISSKQLDDLKRSITKYNLAEIPALNLDGTILAGHQRVRALIELGRSNEEIDVRIPNRLLTKKEADQYMIASNALGGDWDFEKLKSFDIGELLVLGFDPDELSGLWDSNLETEDDDFDVESEIAKITKPKTKVGEIYQLGPHRLAVGDSTDPAVVKKLFGKDHASMIYSDPVYNLNIDYNGGLGGKQNYGGNVNDKRTDTEYKIFLKKSLENALTVSKPDVHIFYWCDETYIGLIQDIYRELDITNKRVCLWIKNGANPTPGVAFNKCYEPCVYGVKNKPYLTKGIENLNEVLNREVATGNRLIDDILDLLNIWLVKRLAGNDYQHATSKPPTLHEKAIRRCTRPGDIIFDSFLGSGSTLIAAEQLKRRCYGIDLEPKFCDLIIIRYEKLTNIKAKKIN
ncbi:MAG: DNA modification methylase [Candidatus Parcubacteria bacterium]|nr:DNA modification methylase [Candidatus Parcubacteria bacterium]